MHPASSLAALDGDLDVAPRLVVASVPGLARGMSYDVAQGATLGRGDVEIQLEDPFASSHHARLTRQGAILVIEDLGSTNGTYLNDELLRGPRPCTPATRSESATRRSPTTTRSLMLRVATDHFSHSDTGLARRANEDAYYARAPIFVVADGMGGAQAGEVASRMAIEAFERGVRRR